MVPVGVGLTSTVAVIAVPLQPLADGVIVKVTVTGALVVLIRVPEILPVPDAPIPITVARLSLLQLYVALFTTPVTTIVVIGVPEQIV